MNIPTKTSATKVRGLIPMAIGGVKKFIENRKQAHKDFRKRGNNKNYYDY